MAMAKSRTGRSPWQRAVPDPAGPVPVARAVAVAALLTGLIALASVTVASLSSPRVALVDAGPSGPPPASADTAEAASAEEDSPLSATPAHRTGLAFLHLDDRLEEAVAVLGPPDRQEPDINATSTSTWVVAPASEFAVTGDDHGVTGLAARVPVDSPVRVGAHAGVVIGESTPAQVAESWGDDHDVTSHAGEDFVLRYIECVGPFPVVIKFDQDTADGGIAWDEPVTSVFISYADAEPGTNGCPAS